MQNIQKEEEKEQAEDKEVQERGEEAEAGLRLYADIMVEHCGGGALAIQVEVGVLSHIDRGGSIASGLHADL